MQPINRHRLSWKDKNYFDMETNSFMDFGWNLFYSSKEKSKAMYKTITKKLIRNRKISLNHLSLILACAVEWGLEHNELMKFLWKEVKLFDNEDSTTNKEKIKEVSTLVKTHIADGSGLALMQNYYNVKVMLQTKVNKQVVEHDTKILSSAIDKHDCIKKAGNRCIRIKEITEYLKVKEPDLFMIMKEKRVEMFIARILKERGYVKSHDRLSTIWENPHVLATRKVKLTYNSPIRPSVQCRSKEDVFKESLREYLKTKKEISTSVDELSAYLCLKFDNYSNKDDHIIKSMLQECGFCPHRGDYGIVWSYTNS